jgi:hypothetical protein
MRGEMCPGEIKNGQLRVMPLLRIVGDAQNINVRRERGEIRVCTCVQNLVIKFDYYIYISKRKCKYNIKIFRLFQESLLEMENSWDVRDLCTCSKCYSYECGNVAAVSTNVPICALISNIDCY